MVRTLQPGVYTLERGICTHISTQIWWPVGSVTPSSRIVTERRWLVEVDGKLVLDTEDLTEALAALWAARGAA